SRVGPKPWPWPCSTTWSRDPCASCPPGQSRNPSVWPLDLALPRRTLNAILQLNGQLLWRAAMGRTSDARERLIARAIYLIGSRSYCAVSVDDLCAHAGVNKGSFYHFFPAKRALALVAIDVQWEQARRRLFDPAFVPDV